ncbi:MAG: hypothetical protein ABIJ61_06975 [bacterium]
MKYRFALLFSALALSLLLAACGGDEPKTQKMGARGAVDSTTGVAAPDFEWNIITKPLVTFYYQPDDSLAFRADALASRIDQVLYTVATAFGWENPKPIEFYCYRDEATMRHYTGREEQFYIGKKFFYGYGPNYGPMMPQYVIENFPAGRSQFDFFNEGMLLALDFSGKNYNQACFNFLSDGTLNPVSELTDNSLYQQISEVRRPIEAASLISYLYDTFGLLKVQKLYRSERNSFEAAAEYILEKTVAELHEGWVEYLPKHTNEMERIRELESGS